MTLPTIAEKLAATLRTHAKCQCETKTYWPWRREVTCARCAVLELYEAHIAIVQTNVPPKGRP
jgi:hypothetical protein